MHQSLRFAVCLVLLAAAPAQALDIDLDRLRFEPKAGLTFSKLALTNGPDGGADSPRMGLMAGAGFDLPLHEYISAHPEALLVMKGERFNAAVIGRTRAKLGYLSFPLLVKGHYDFGPLRGRVLTGPYMDVLLAARGTASRSTTGAGDVGWIAEGGIEYPLKKSDLTVTSGIRFAGGILDITNGAGRVKNRTIAMVAGVLL